MRRNSLLDSPQSIQQQRVSYIQYIACIKVESCGATNAANAGDRHEWEGEKSPHLFTEGEALMQRVGKKRCFVPGASKQRFVEMLWGWSSPKLCCCV